MQRFFSLMLVLGLFGSFFFNQPAHAAPNPWVANTAYAVGSQVSYNGAIYECLQAHTALIGWEPATTPALWKQVNATQSPTAIPATSIPPTAPPATNVPPTATATPTASCLNPAAGAGWQSRSLSNQTGNFSLSFEAMPSASPTNAVIGLANAIPTDYTGLAIAVRFNPTGSIDARNGGTYAAATNVAYSANTRYRFRVVINLVAHTYSVYVTPQTASEILIASNYAFRSEQANVSNLNTLATVVGGTGAVGSLNLCNISLNLPATPTPLPTATPTPRPTATPTPRPTATPPPASYTPAFCANYPPAIVAGSWQSSVVSYNNGRLQYTSDSAQNRIPDFSYAGYYSGQRPLPNLAVIQTLSPISGDNTVRIQQALDAIGNRTPDAQGLRGALLLAPGRYTINGTVRINKSGVVLRGSGDGGDASNATILLGAGNTPHQRTLIVVGNGDSTPWTAGSATNVTDQFVQVGSKSLNVADASRFTVGQEVIVRHPSSQAWINAVNGGGVVSDAWWAVGALDMTWTRRVTKIAGTTLTLDAPIFNHLDRALSQATVAPVTSRNIIANAGVENLRVDIQTAGGEDENHVWDAIGVVGAEDSWVKNATVLHFGHAGVFTQGAIRITVDDVQALDPVGIRTGGRFYNFDAESNSQLVLFTKVHATGGRHSFISNGTQTTSGIVWHRSTEGGGSDSEGHRQWSQGLLFDTINASAASNIQLINRGDYGTSHGWGNVHSVIWNYNRTMVVQKPPTGQNYAISQAGTRSTSYPFPGAGGFADIRSGSLVPNSLYEAQLCDRLEN